VAHGLTVLVVQSVAAQEDLEHGAGRAQLARRLQASEEVARESLHELRTLLGILGASAEGSGAASGLSGIEALVDRLRAAGLEVDLHVEGDAAAVGPGLELATYRIVQEGLTNAAKHGDGSAVVRLGLTEGQVEIDVENPCAAQSDVPGAGRGLPGLRERVALHHGTLEAGADGGLYRLRAVLPVVRDRQPIGSES
jgi:signal transduction histidine kinase